MTKARKKKNSIQISDAAAESIIRLTDKRGIAKTFLVEKVMVWFEKLPSPVRRAILDDVDDVMQPIYAGFLLELAKRLDEKEFSLLLQQSVHGKAAGQTLHKLPPAKGKQEH